MSLKLSELIENGYKAQAMKLSRQLKDNHKKWQFEQTREWSAIGARVNYSFYEVTDKNSYNKNEIRKALEDLGVRLDCAEGKKWYQFWLKDGDVRLINAIKRIQ